MGKFKEGEARPVNAGRKPGTPNKASLKVSEKAEQLGCDPIEFLCMVMIGDETLSPELDQRIAAAKELASYMFPKLKAVEHSGPNGLDVFSKLIEGLNGSRKS